MPKKVNFSTREIIKNKSFQMFPKTPQVNAYLDLSSSNKNLLLKSHQKNFNGFRKSKSIKQHVRNENFKPLNKGIVKKKSYKRAEEGIVPNLDCFKSYDIIPNKKYYKKDSIHRYYDFNNKASGFKDCYSVKPNLDNHMLKQRLPKNTLDIKENQHTIVPNKTNRKSHKKNISIFSKNSFQSLRIQDLGVKICHFVRKRNKCSITSIKAVEDSTKQSSKLASTLTKVKSHGSLTIRNYQFGDKNFEKIIKKSNVINIRDLENFIFKTENLIKEAKANDIKNPEIKGKLKNEIEKSVMKAQEIGKSLHACKVNAKSKMETFLESFLEMVDNERVERISRLEPHDVSKIIYDQHQTVNNSFMDEIQVFDSLFQSRQKC